MVLILCIVNFVLLALLLTGGSYAVVKTRRDIQEALDSFFLPQAEGELSRFNQIIVQTGDVVAQQVSASVGGVLNGAFGGAMKGAVHELEEEAVRQSPSLAVMQVMPKSIRKNNVASMIFQQLIDNSLKPYLTGKGGDASRLSGSGNGDVVLRRNPDAGAWG